MTYQSDPPIAELILAGCLIDGVNPAPRFDQAIRIVDGRIVLIEDWSPGETAPHLDLSSFVVIPGLIDTHAHLTFDPGASGLPYDPHEARDKIIQRTRENLQAMLSAGVTTAGDCGAQDEVIFPIRQACQLDPAGGPRILTSGYAIVPQGGHGAELIGREASGVEWLRQVVVERASAGADFIKVMATAGGGEAPGQSHYDLQELIAIRETADRCGLLVVAHAHGVQGIQDCVRAGIQRIEHCTFYAPDGSFAFDLATAQEIANQGIIVTPTNAIDYRRIARGVKGAPREELIRIWRQLLEAGVVFAAGSDAGVNDIFYADYALIPELMVGELGMSPWQALQACTRTAAMALRLENTVGTLEPGKQADLVVLAGNPLDDITALHKVSQVFRNGQAVYRNPKYQ